MRPAHPPFATVPPVGARHAVPVLRTPISAQKILRTAIHLECGAPALLSRRNRLHHRYTLRSSQTPRPPDFMRVRFLRSLFESLRPNALVSSFDFQLSTVNLFLSLNCCYSCDASSSSPPSPPLSYAVSALSTSHSPPTNPNSPSPARPLAPTDPHSASANPSTAP
jgi:hypothetical protein